MIYFLVLTIFCACDIMVLNIGGNMKTKLTCDDVVKGFELLGINKSLDDVKLLNARYQTMKNVQDKYDSINNAIKNKISKLEDMFKEFGITFSSDDVFATAFFQGEKLCQFDRKCLTLHATCN